MSQNPGQSQQKPQDAAAASVFHPVESKTKQGGSGNQQGASKESSVVAKASNEANRQQEMEVS